MPHPTHPWLHWTTDDWLTAGCQRVGDVVSCEGWLLVADDAGRNILMASLYHGAPQDFVQSLFCCAARDTHWRCATEHETQEGVGLLAHVFRFATKRRFDYRHWQEVTVRACPIRSSAGKGLLWQLARLAQSTDSPSAWWVDVACVDPAWLDAGPLDWQAGLERGMTRQWLTGRLLRPLRHLAGTLQTSASPDLHEVSKFLRPLHLRDMGRIDPGQWQSDLLDAMDVLHVVWTALDRYGIEKGFDRVHAWDPILPALSRLHTYAPLEDGVFADLLSRHAHGDAGWDEAVKRARALHQAHCLEEATTVADDRRGGRRL